MKSNLQQEIPVYVYGIISGNFRQLKDGKDFIGIDGEHTIRTIDMEELSLVVCDLDSEEFSQENLNVQGKDPGWVQEKATHHHDVLSSFSSLSPILPLKFCTIYSSESNLKADLSVKKETIKKLISFLSGKEEWNLKIYCQVDRIKDFLLKENNMILQLKKEIESASAGRQFFLRKRLESFLSEEASRETRQYCLRLEEKLSKYFYASKEKQLWSKQVTGKKEDLIWNQSYLIEKDSGFDPFNDAVKQFQKTYEQAGIMVQLTGPWPPYDFVDGEF
jgi:hypothetical protein